MKRQFVVAIMTWLVIGMGVILNAAAADSINIGLTWIGKSDSASRYATGLAEFFQKNAPNIALETQPALASEEEFAQVATRFQQEKQAMIVLRSNGATWLATHPPTIPTFLGGLNHPAYLGVVKTLDAPEGNMTGVSYFVPVNTQFEIFQAIVPNLKSIWLLLEKDNASGLVDQEQFKQFCDAAGIEFHESVCATPEDVIAATQQAVQQGVSAILLGNASLVIDNAEAIVTAAGMIPTFSSLSPVTIEKGVLGGFSANEIVLIQMLAESVVDVLINGKAIKNVPFKFDPKPQFLINETTAQRLQLNVPYEILQHATIVK